MLPKNKTDLLILFKRDTGESVINIYTGGVDKKKHLRYVEWLEELAIEKFKTSRMVRTLIQ